MPLFPRKIFRYLFASELVIAFYILVISIIILVFHKNIPQWELFLFYHFLVIVFSGLIIYAYSRFNRRFWHLLRHWYPMVLILCAFRELYYLVHSVSPNDLDTLLVKWDRFLLGTDPTVFIEKYIAFPLLTEYLQIIYALFYFLPISLGVILYVQKRYDVLKLCLTGILMGFFSSYFGFFIIPALGPRFEIHHGNLLQGLYVTEWINNCLNSMELQMRDCFPSGHVEVSMMVLWYFYRYLRKYFWLILIIVLSLTFSTVYLRYHYVVDVIAGIILAAIMIFCADLLTKWVITYPSKVKNEMPKNPLLGGDKRGGLRLSDNH